MILKKVVYLGGDIAQISTISDLVQSGYQVILVDNKKTAPGRKKTTHFLQNNCEDGEAIFKSLLNLNIAFDDVYIYPSSERFLATARFLSYALHKKCSEQYLLYANKIRSKQFLNSLSIPSLPFELIPHDIEGICEKFPYPSVAKRAFGWGGRSVQLINNKSDLIAYIYNNELGQHNPGILERFLDSPEITAGGVLVNNSYTPLVEYQTLSKHDSFELEYLMLNHELAEQYNIAHSMVAKIMKTLRLEGQFLAANFFADRSVWLLEFGPVISHIYANLIKIINKNTPLKLILDFLNGMPKIESDKFGCWGSKVLYTQNDDTVFENFNISHQAKKIRGYRGCHVLRPRGYHLDQAYGPNTPIVVISAVGRNLTDTQNVLDEVSELVRILKK